MKNFSNLIAIAIAAASFNASAQTTESLHKASVATQHCLKLGRQMVVISHAKGAVMERTCYKGVQPLARAADEKSWKRQLVAGATVYTEESGSAIIPPSLGGENSAGD